MKTFLIFLLFAATLFADAVPGPINRLSTGDYGASLAASGRNLVLYAYALGPAGQTPEQPTAFAWARNGQPVPAARPVTANYIILDGVTQADAGLYELKWTSASGAIHTERFVLSVGAPFTPVTVAALPENSAFGTPLNLVATGTRPFRIRWTFHSFRGEVEIPAARDLETFTPTRAGYYIARLSNEDPAMHRDDLAFFPHGFLWDDALGRMVHARVHSASTWTWVAEAPAAAAAVKK